MPISIFAAVTVTARARGRILRDGPSALLRMRREGGGGTGRRSGARGDATPAEEAVLAASGARARAAIGRVRKVDPTWKPTPGLFETAEGEIRHNEAVVREAEARLRQLDRKLPQPRALSDIFMPDGNLIGFANRGAGVEVRTVSPRQFQGLLDRLMTGAEPVQTPPGYQGQYYRRADGTTFGVRLSKRHGVTVDIIEHGGTLTEDNMKVHQK